MCTGMSSFWDLDWSLLQVSLHAQKRTHAVVHGTNIQVIQNVNRRTILHDAGPTTRDFNILWLFLRVFFSLWK